jgi:hypothetical protein
MTVEAGVSRQSHRTLKKPKLDVLDEALWIWFYQERRKGTPIPGPVIEEKVGFVFPAALHSPVMITNYTYYVHMNTEPELNCMELNFIP